MTAAGVEELCAAGNRALRESRFEAALDDYAKALALEPRNPHLLNNRGVALRHLKRLDEALASFTAALKSDPKFVSAYSNRANILWSLRREAESLADHRKALSLDPGSAAARANLAFTLRETGHFDEALAEYDRALAIDPHFATAQHDRGQLLLLLGRLEEGYPGVEYRWKPDYNYPESARAASRTAGRPMWQGQSAAELGGRLLILAEQGFGDTMFLARYVMPLAEAGYDIIFEVPFILFPLIRESLKHPRIAVTVQASTLPRMSWWARAVMRLTTGRLAFKAYAGTLSLPLLAGTTLETIPAPVPYLSVPEALADRWRTRMGNRDRLRVGFVWQGDPKHHRDAHRSIPWQAFESLLDVPGIAFYSLQKHAAETAGFPAGSVSALGPEFQNFLDTAAAMQSLDLVISIDSAVAHLAGALARPTWILIESVPEWRWMLDIETSPWYPTARLFRQRKADDWPEVLARVKAELTLLAAAPRA